MLTLTESARERIRSYIDRSEGELTALRIASGDASPGAASWELTLVADDEWNATDVEVEIEGLTVLVAREVAGLLEGATVDYVVRDREEGFQIHTEAAPPETATGGPEGSVAAGTTPTAPPPETGEEAPAGSPAARGGEEEGAGPPPLGGEDLPRRPPPTEEERIEIENPPEGPLADRIRELLETRINPAVSMHGGHIGLADVKDGEIFIVMSGGCQGCALSRMTLQQGVERMIRQEVPEVTGVHDVTDHEKGENPYYEAPIP